MKLHRYWLLCLPLLFSSAVFAAEPTPEQVAESKEAEEEDKAAVGKDFAGGFEFIGRGKFKLYGEGESENKEVVGLFSCDGKLFQVKVENEQLKKDLAPHNGKDVGLSGKLRNKGKYLVVQSISVGAPPPDSFRNPRGL
jgi:hypothetical protein